MAYVWKMSDEDRERRKNIYYDFIFTYILNQYFLTLKQIWDLRESSERYGRGYEAHAQPLVVQFWGQI